MTPLHEFGTMLRDLLIAVPLIAVRLLFVGTLVAVLLWVLLLPRETAVPPGGSRRWDENLKFGAVLALAIQIAIYCLL